METAPEPCPAAAAVLDFFLGVPLVAFLGASSASCRPRRVKIARSKAAHVALAPSILFAASNSAYSLHGASGLSSPQNTGLSIYVKAIQLVVGCEHGTGDDIENF